MKTLIVLPTYNEILNISPMLHALRESVSACDILVVDDGSPDGTAAKAEEVSEKLGHISLLKRTSKNGLGGAYRAGFQWGIDRGYDHFVEIDCDFSHNPAVLPTLLNAAETHEVVIGSRYIKGGEIPKWSLSRRLLSRGGNQYASFMLGLRVRDATSGYRVYSKTALEKIDFQNVQADGYGFQIEMTYRARRHGASIIEIPISFSDRELGESKMSSMIVFEALFLVTKWALLRPFRR